MALTLGRARWPRSKGKVFASWAPCLPHCSAIGETVSSLEQPQPQVPESEWPPPNPGCGLCCRDEVVLVGVRLPGASTDHMVSLPVSCYPQSDKAHTEGVEWGFPFFQTHSGGTPAGSLL